MELYKEPYIWADDIGWERLTSTHVYVHTQVARLVRLKGARILVGFEARLHLSMSLTWQSTQILQFHLQQGRN